MFEIKRGFVQCVILPIMVLCLSLGGEKTKTCYIKETIKELKSVCKLQQTEKLYSEKKNPCTKGPVFIHAVQRMFLRANKSSQCGELGENSSDIWLI